MAGKLIVLSGLDGSGKSTQVELIKNYFKQQGIKYAYLHFPLYSENESGKVISSYLRGDYGGLNEVDPLFVANMYAMNRFQYLPQLQRLLEENQVVLLDRYVFCNMAFQSAKYPTDTQKRIIIDWINEFEFGFLELPYPDLTIFVDTPLEFIESRLNVREKDDDREYLNGKKDIHEADIEFQKRVREVYLNLKAFQNYIIVDCESDSPEQIFEKYKKNIDHALI